MSSAFDTFATQLYRAEDFVEIGQVVCVAARPVFGLHQIVIMLNAPDGRPLISADSMEGDHDEMRLAYMTEIWKLDPFLADLRTRHVFEQRPDADWMKFSRETGYRGDDVFSVTLPITALPRVIGIIRCGALTEYTDAQLTDLRLMSTQVAVRLAQLGVTSNDEPSGLTARQVDTVQLAAVGLSNVQIADHLKISENTVKKHLKLAFAELGVVNRTELAVRLARVGRRDRIATGITHFDGCTITKAAE